MDKHLTLIDNVRAIRKLYKKKRPKWTQNDLSNEFDMSVSQVKKILNHSIYDWVDDKQKKKKKSFKCT